MSAHGVDFGAPSIDLDGVRGWKESVVKRLTGGLTALARQRKVTVVTGEGKFTSPHTLAVETAEGAKHRPLRQGDHRGGLGAGRAGLHPEGPAHLGFDRRAGAQPDPQAPAGARRRHHRPRDGDGLRGAGLQDHRHRDDGPVDAGRRPRHRRALRQAGREALREDPAEDQGHRGRGARRRALRRLRGRGRRRRRRRSTRCWSRSGAVPTAARIGAEAAGVKVDERGFIAVDKQMRTNVPHIFAIGDIVGQPMLAHKATHEGKVAAEVGERPQVGVRRQGDPLRRLYRSGSRLGRRHRDRGQGQGTQIRQGGVSLGGERALALARAATRASPRRCGTRRAAG